MPEVRTPHFEAMILSWARVRDGSWNAIHDLVVLVMDWGKEVRWKTRRDEAEMSMQGYQFSL